VCVNEEPPLREVEPEHFWRCHHSIEALREMQRTAPPERHRDDTGPEPSPGDSAERGGES
jgi:hypothetical protein